MVLNAVGFLINSHLAPDVINHPNMSVEEAELGLEKPQNRLAHSLSQSSKIAGSALTATNLRLNFSISKLVGARDLSKRQDSTILYASPPSSSRLFATSVQYSGISIRLTELGVKFVDLIDALTVVRQAGVKAQPIIKFRYFFSLGIIAGVAERKCNPAGRIPVTSFELANL